MDLNINVYLKRKNAILISQAIVFILTYLLYSLYHASRKTLSNVKTSIKEQWTPINNSYFQNEHFVNDSNWVLPNYLYQNDNEADQFLGALDAIFMAAYAIGLYMAGYLGDRYDARYVVSIGMIGSGFSLILFGAVPEWLDYNHKWWFIVFYIIFGLFQSLGWPSLVSVMAQWFSAENRGLTLGLWSSCQSVGNILGASIVATFLPYGFENAFVANGLLIIAGGCIAYIGLVADPTDIYKDFNEFVDTNGVDRDKEQTQHSDSIANGYGMIDDTENVNSSDAVSEDHHNHNDKPINFITALLLPSVIMYCLCTACLKFVNYAFFFWLPLYMTESLHWTENQSGIVSTAYDIGAIIGSVIGGVISDRLHVRSPVIVTMLILSLGALFYYPLAPIQLYWNAFFVSLIGVTVNGPYNLIVSTISADLGRMPHLIGNSQAMSTVTGLIDGTGSVGSSIGQIFIPMINNKYGWNVVFYLFIIMNIVAILCLVKLCIKDVKTVINRFRQIHSQNEREPLIGR